MVYICSPLRANARFTMEENLERAKAICRHCAVNGVLAIAVHLYFTQFLDDNIEEERVCGMEHGKALLAMCKEVWVFGDIISSGMQAEIELAEELGIPIKYFPDVDAWLRGKIC